jgi:hypothetical protein
MMSELGLTFACISTAFPGSGFNIAVLMASLMGSVLSGFIVLFGKCESILKAKQAEQYLEQVDESTSNDSGIPKSGALLEEKGDTDKEKPSARDTHKVRHEIVL